MEIRDRKFHIVHVAKERNEQHKTFLNLSRQNLPHITLMAETQAMTGSRNLPMAGAVIKIRVEWMAKFIKVADSRARLGLT